MSAHILRWPSLHRQANAVFLHTAAQAEQRLGLTDKPAPTSSPQPLSVPAAASSLQADAACDPAKLPPAQPASPSIIYQPMDTTPLEQRQTHSAQLPANSTSTLVASQNAALQGQSSPHTASASQAPETNDASAASSSSDAKPIPAGFDRQIHVFTREAAAAAEASSRYSASCLKTPSICSLLYCCRGWLSFLPCHDVLSPEVLLVHPHIPCI